MELRHLRYFVAVAEELHFGRAAERLHIVQPALSKQVFRLEEELGVRLLHRSKRRVRLTEAGEVFCEEARRILADTEQAAEAAKRAAQGQIGKLAVGFFGPAAYSILPEILGTYRNRFPDVELTIYEWTTPKQMEELRGERIQVGFGRGPINDSALIAETVFREPVMVALPEGHPLATRDTVPLAMLAEDTFVIVPRRKEPTSYDKYVGLCQQAGFSPQVVQEAEHIHALVALVAAGIGLALVPASVRNLRRPGVVYRALQAPTAEVETVVIWRQEAPSPVLENFLSTVRELTDNFYFAYELPWV